MSWSCYKYDTLNWPVKRKQVTANSITKHIHNALRIPLRPSLSTKSHVTVLPWEKGGFVLAPLPNNDALRHSHPMPVLEQALLSSSAALAFIAAWLSLIILQDEQIHWGKTALMSFCIPPGSMGVEYLGIQSSYTANRVGLQLTMGF